MIPLTRRNATRGAALVSYTRQTLPRPARLYSTPTKKVSQEHAATSHATPSPEYPAFMPSPSGSSSRPLSIHPEMHGFLGRGGPYTILPTPMPDDVIPAPGDSILFTDSPTQDQVAVLDACLRGNDVPRAKLIFERLRDTRVGDPVLESGLYNSLIDAYLGMAGQEELNRANWLEDAWALYNDMEGGHDKVNPTPRTYALMLKAWLRHNPDASQPVFISGAEIHDPVSLLRNIIGRGISPALIVSDQTFTSDEEATEGIKALSRAAAEMGLASVVQELGLTEFLGKQLEDPLEDVPEVIPVMKRKKIEVVQQDDGTVSQLSTDELPQESEGQIPFNLETLRRHLSAVVLARRVLSEDVVGRQKLLENSVYHAAAERMKHQSDMMDELGLPSRGLQSSDLKSWTWDWHQKLQARIKAELENLIVEERVIERMKRKKPLKRDEVPLLSPFLRLLSPEKLSLITIMEVMHLHNSGGVRDGMGMARALLSVGRAVEAEYKAEMRKKNNISVPVPTSTPPRAGSQNVFTADGYKDLYARRVTARKYMEDSEEWTSDWSQLVRVKVGSFLVDCIMDVATVTRAATDPRTGEKI